MSRNKKNEFQGELLDLSEMAKALAHPARPAILLHLARQHTCVCGELVDALPLAQATVSQHLSELKRAGLIQGEIEGPRMCYCLNPSAVRLLKERMNRFLDRIDVPLDDSCCRPEDAGVAPTAIPGVPAV